jgi:hypothetical protein
MAKLSSIFSDTSHIALMVMLVMRVYAIDLSLPNVTCADRQPFLSQYFNYSCSWDSDNSTSRRSQCYQFMNSASRPDPSNFRNRNYYLMGNSVIRHYSFAIGDFLENLAQDTHIDRIREKSTCRGILGISSCNHWVVNNTVFIDFMWRLSTGELFDSHDESRDACTSIDRNTTEGCIKELFRNVSSNDVLIIGSVPVHSKGLLGKTYSMNEFSTLKDLAFSGTNATNYQPVLQTFLRHFPGPIIWMSYPHVKGEFYKYWEYIQYTNDAVKCAISTLNSDRFVFLNVLALQKENEHLYQDLIHHPGRLSQMIIDLIFSIIRPV